MSSSKQPADPVDDIDPTDRIKGFLARQRPAYVGGPITPKEALEDYIKTRGETNYVQARVDDAFPEITETVDVELQEGDGRTRGLSDVLPPGKWPRGDVYQYVPRRELRTYEYDCENTRERTVSRWSISDQDRVETTTEEECPASWTLEGRGLPSMCPRCGGWVRPEDDK